VTSFYSVIIHYTLHGFIHLNVIVIIFRENSKSHIHLYEDNYYTFRFVERHSLYIMSKYNRVYINIFSFDKLKVLIKNCTYIYVCKYSRWSYCKCIAIKSLFPK